MREEEEGAERGAAHSARREKEFSMKHAVHFELRGEGSAEATATRKAPEVRINAF